MKKIIVFLCVFLIMIPLFGVNSLAAHSTVSIYKTAVAPTIDGDLDDGYRLVASTTEDPDLFNILTNTEGVNTTTEFYACWDDDYLYIFVKAACNEPHVAYQDDAAEHFIFNAHYMMTALCPDDSTKSVYTGTEAGGGWSWENLYNANLMYEWTIIEDSNNGNNVISNHFLTMGETTGYTFDVKAEDGFDCYEQKIPMKKLVTAQVASGFVPEVGAEFGLGFAIGFTDAGTGYEGDKDTADFSNYFLDGKIINGLTLVQLASDLTDESSVVNTSDVTSAESEDDESTITATSNDVEDDSVAASSTQSLTNSTTDDAETFDDWWIVIAGAAALIVIIAVVLVVSKKKKV